MAQSATEEGLTNTFLSHNTALTYWRNHFPLDAELSALTCAINDEGCAARAGDVIESVPEEYIVPNHPVDVLVFNDKERRKSKEVNCHSWETLLPKDAFYRTRGIYISSPEFVFLQMAQRLTLIQLIALGCELCGTYVLLPKGEEHPGSPDAMPKRLYPLTNTTKIAKLLDTVNAVPGKSNAQRALKYVVDGARSPMETMVYMLLCLPVMLGGYGIPKPQLNLEIALDAEGRTIAQRSRCEGDLCWPDAKLDIEYHGEVHVGAAQMKSDDGRELGIEHMGWRVMTITSPQVLAANRFEVIAREVASCLGWRLRTRALGITPKRSNLRFELERLTFTNSDAV